MSKVTGIAAISFFIFMTSVGAQKALFDRDLLVDDTRQLADIIENVHPNPYINGGGKIAFHRRLHQILNAIPDEGMTDDDFYALLAPFVAAIGDAHTRLQPLVNNAQPGGIPFGLRCFDTCLYIRSVVGEQYTNFLGARLESVEGVPFDELLNRYRKLLGTENLFNLIDNLRFPLWYGSQLIRLVPEWQQREDVRLELSMPDGKIEQLVVPLARDQSAQTYVAGTEFRRPSTSKCDFNWGFVGDNGEAAILVVTDMSTYREALERRDDLGVSRESNERRARKAYQRYHGSNPPESYEEVRAGVPSATDVFLTMLKEMKAANTGLLIVDLRGNSGGSSAMSTILIYFLYGIDAILDLNETSIETRKYSHYYFETHDNVTLEDLNEGRRIPLAENDYLFSDNDPCVHDPDKTELRRSLKAQLDKSAAAMPTFGKLYSGGQYEAFYHPEQVVVLCDANTFSSGYTMMYHLYQSGATLLGTPSGQAINVFGAAVNFELDHTDLTVYVSQMRYESFSLDAESSRALMPHYVMTYDQLASYDFDPNAEIRWALELFLGK